MALFSEPMRGKYVEKNDINPLLTWQSWKTDITQSLPSLCQMEGGEGRRGERRIQFLDFLKCNVGKRQKRYWKRQAFKTPA